MPEGAQIRALPSKTSDAQITAMSARAVLRLKSWLPEHSSGAQPVMLAGGELPSQVGATVSGPLRILCVGPGEWLIVSHERRASKLREDIESDLTRYGLALVELTHGLAGLEVRGCDAREVLSKGCGLDFHPRAFRVGRCARTRFAQIPVVIDCLDESPRFELYVARSYFHYMHSWITAAAAAAVVDPLGRVQ
jgi:sarcosine oxidase, subunit gamma